MCKLNIGIVCEPNWSEPLIGPGCRALYYACRALVEPWFHGYSTLIHQFYYSASTRLRSQTFSICHDDKSQVGTPLCRYLPSTQVWIQAPNQEPAQELPSRAGPRVEAHHCVNGPDTEKNSWGMQTIKKGQTRPVLTPETSASTEVWLLSTLSSFLCGFFVAFGSFW